MKFNTKIFFVSILIISFSLINSIRREQIKKRDDPAPTTQTSSLQIITSVRIKIFNF